MRISKLLLPSLATVVSVAAQGAFRHLPQMPSQQPQRPDPVKMVVAPPKPITSPQCAIPLLNVTPDNKANFTIRTIAPPKEPAGAMIYVQTAPVCGEVGSVKK